QEESYLFAQKQLNFLSEHSIIQGNLQETMINILELDFLFEQIVNQPFVQLPMVTSEQIELSRRIQRFFTDDLEAPVICELNFPGIEKHLLCAKIQRITAINDDEEEEEEEDMDEETMNLHQIKFDINTNFEGNRLEDLALSHDVAYIYKQGRNLYFHQHNKNQEERKSTIQKISIEQDPHLLSSISKDISIHGLYPAWSIGMASTLIPEYTLIYARSNR
ncbi:unnamed protein product, partial [Rotaria sp. Silwood1]